MIEGIYYAKAAAFIGASIAMGLGSIGPALGQGFIGTKACESVGKYPENANKIRFMMMLAMGMVETSAIYAFIVGLMLILYNV